MPAQLHADDAEAWKALTVEEIRARAPRVDLHGRTYFLVEHDLRLREEQLPEYVERRNARHRVPRVRVTRAVVDIAPRGGDALVVELTPGSDRIYRWRPGKKLSYCVRRDTFPSEDAYTGVRDRLGEATTDWEDACGVEFEHRAELDEQDGITPGDEVVFTVEYTAGNPSTKNVLATAFFPRDPVADRIVLIFPTFYGRHRFDTAGILRHELGHLLGFRHEHIREDAVPPPEDWREDIADTFNVTRYDRRSVMHYPYGRVGTRRFEISRLDREAAVKIYGRPFAAFHFCD